jgi:hypothetical protein
MPYLSAATAHAAEKAVNATTFAAWTPARYRKRDGSGLVVALMVAPPMRCRLPDRAEDVVMETK